MATPDQVIRLRAVQGVDRIEDARITDQGSWFYTQNLYGRNPGVLAKRPGSVKLANGAAASVQVPYGTGGALGSPVIAAANLGSAQTLTAIDPLRFSGFTPISGSASGATGYKGPRNKAPAILSYAPPIITVPNNATTLTFPPNKVSGLHRLYMDLGEKRFWVGAYSLPEPNGDTMFYLIQAGSPSAPTFTARIINVHQGLSHSHGGEWFFTNYRYLASGDAATKAYFCIVTNGVDQPFVLKDGADYSTATDIAIAALNVASSASTFPLAAATKRLVAAQSICVYNGSIVYGGYKMLDPTGVAAVEDYDNYVTFSIPGEPHKLANTSGIISNFRVGDSLEEPITHVGVNATATSGQGIKGQLVCFTGKRVVIYDGLPPVDNNPTGTNFSTVTMRNVGCNAPRSVQQTPYGMVFLGSDGIVYLIPLGSVSGPIPIGRAVQPLFKHMIPVQQKQCASFYKDGFYCLSYINNPTSKNVETLQYSNIPSVQMWADLRYMSPQENDAAVRWYGPMTGQWHSCFAVADGPQDRGQIAAGSALNGDVFQVWREDTMSDPKTTQSAAGVADPTLISVDALTGPFDLGDAHIDKTVTAASIGIGTNITTSVVANIITAGDTLNSEEGFQTTLSVDPVGAVLGTGLLMDGTKFFSDDTTFNVQTIRPSKRMRGKFFRFRFAEAAPGDAKLFFSDLSFRAIVATRRT